MASGRERTGGETVASEGRFGVRRIHAEGGGTLKWEAWGFQGREGVVGVRIRIAG